MHQLTEAITDYLAYLRNEVHLSVSVHFSEQEMYRLPGASLEKLLQYNSHTNPYCVIIKSNGIRMERCLCEQRLIYETPKTSESFFRTCHAGVYEYISTIRENDRCIGFVAVSGFRQGNTPCGTDAEMWKKHLCGDPFPLMLCKAVVPPLCIMLTQLFALCPPMEKNEQNAILQYLSENHTTVTLSDVCRRFYRSKSYISHMFKKTYGVSFRRYCCMLKLQDAEKMLLQTDYSVTEIAHITGFNDTSYFISAFRNEFGLPPLRYRNQNKKKC